MPRRYLYVQDTSTITAATANHVASLLWNPSSSHTLYVREVECFLSGSGVANYGLARTSTAGATPNKTWTPNALEDWDDEIVPPSGAVVYTGVFGTQPTVQLPYLFRANTPGGTNLIGLGFSWIFEDEPIHVPPGTGLAIATPVAVTIPPMDSQFLWEEGGP